MTLEERFEFMTLEDSILKKDWAAGSSKPTTANEFLIAHDGAKLYTARYATINYAPALWKIIDEPIVNALDHGIRSAGPHKVTVIKIELDRTGRVNIYNDGPGIEIAVHKVATERLGREIYLPTFVFGHPFQGSNRNRADNCIIGGTNGLGAKLSNCFSTEFIVETVDSQKYFIQRWRNNKTIEEPPKIIDLSGAHKVPLERTRQHTMLSFMPDYATFGFDGAPSELCDLVRTRAFLAAAYAGYAFGAKVWFNHALVPIASIADIAAIIFPKQQVFRSVVDGGPKTYQWEVCAVVTNTTIYEYPHLSNVNGVMVRDGKHMKHLMNALVEGVRVRISKILGDRNLKFAASHVSSNVFLLANARIPNPDWTGQRKDILDTDIRRFAKYTLDSKFVAAITELLRDRIIDSIFAPKRTVRNKQATEYDKYRAANKAGGRDRRLCGLICTEGNSAMVRASTGIENSIKWDYYGIISMGGVIMNVRKACTVVVTEAGNQVRKSSKLANNVFINALLDIVGLEPRYKYDPLSPTYAKEMAELNYGHIVACVDQDLDGKGNILGLLLNLFELLFPRLLAAGFVKWFCTPIVRAYPKTGGEVISFFSQPAYNKWAAGAAIQKYSIYYYKGIGSHSREETIHMFTVFKEHLYTYSVDGQTHDLFDVYYGTCPDKRKAELSAPVKELSVDIAEAQETSRLISCTNQLTYETMLYQKDNLERKLDSMCDGQNKTGRKILDGLRSAFAKSARRRVDELTGFISDKQHYHHGGDSLEGSITDRGLVTVGGKQLPFIVPHSNFGSRNCGGSEASAARYISASLNRPLVDALFPAADYCNLPFNFDEGVRIEPKYFVPIIPMAIVESGEIPAHGWKMKIWARDVTAVINNVKLLIWTGDNTPLVSMPPCTYKGTQHPWLGEFRTIRGDLYSFGKYHMIDTTTIIITELPLRVWTIPYMEMLNKRKKTGIYIESIEGTADDFIVRISIKLRPGALDALNELGDSVFTDGIEEYFLLRERMDSHINLMGINKEVFTFDRYEDVIYPWFAIRKDFYARRLAREQVLLELRILRLQNIIRYIGACVAFAMPARPEAEMVRLLSAAVPPYDKIHQGRLNSPRFTLTDELRAVVLHGPKANYDYLLDLSDKKKSSESLAQYSRELAELEALLAEMRAPRTERFPGATIWLSELAALEVVIARGQKTGWLYGEAGKYKLG